MVVVGKPGSYILNIAKQPVQQIDIVAELGKQCTPVESSSTMPGIACIVSFIPVPVAMHVYHVYVAQQAFIPQFRGTWTSYA